LYETYDRPLRHRQLVPRGVPQTETPNTDNYWYQLTSKDCSMVPALGFLLGLLGDFGSPVVRGRVSRLFAGALFAGRAFVRGRVVRVAGALFAGALFAGALFRGRVVRGRVVRRAVGRRRRLRIL
jgi:hypothetical protein